MHRNRQWKGSRLWYLLNLKPSLRDAVFIDCLGMTKNNVKNKGVLYRKKIREGLEMSPEIPKDFNPEDTPDEIARKIAAAEKISEITREEIGRTEYQMLAKDPDGNIEVRDLTAIRYRTTQTPEDVADIFQPATPAKITPTRRKQIKRASKLILVYGDAQIDYRRIIDPVTDEMRIEPLHSEAQLEIIQQINAKYMPETTVNLGDMADMAALSRFDADSNHFHQTFSRSMQRVHDFYAELVANNPKATHAEVDSNHAIRPKKAVLKDMPGLHNFVLPGEEYPLLSYYRLANLGKLGIHFVSGYGNAEFVYGEEYNAPPVIFKHGTHSSSSLGATVRKEAAENPEVNIVRGHGHRHEEVRRTMRNNKQLFYLMLGSSCLNRGPVPGYHSSVDDFGNVVANQNPHQNTIAMIEDTKNGNYNITTINIENGKAIYNGEEFNGNKDE